LVDDVKSIFHANLVNDSFEDPSVYVDIPWEKRGLLFDLGSNHHLPTRKLLKVSDVFVTHTHVDHFIGFDHLLRQRLARERPLRIFGPPDIIARVVGKLSGYTWNLVEDYPFVIKVVEIQESVVRTVELRAEDAFEPGDIEEDTVETVPLPILNDNLFTADAVLLDHRIPCVAYSITERLHVNIHREALERRGLPVGEWLRGLKEMVRIGENDDVLVPIPGHESLPLGDLRSSVVSVCPGQKIVYVTDVAFSDWNIDRIVKLADEADIFFCGAPFLERDRKRAQETFHLTSRQAGWLARQARARRMEVFHFSPRYEGEAESLVREAEEAYRGESGAVEMDRGMDSMESPAEQ
jgi:ribonuclease Z